MPVGDLIRAQAAERGQRVFLRFDDHRVTFAEYHRECCRWAALFLSRKQPGKPFHVGILLDNTPDYLFALGGAAVAGAVAVGINNTKRDRYLADDIRHTDCGILVTETKYLEAVTANRDPVAGSADKPVTGSRLPATILVSQRWPEDGAVSRAGGLHDLDDALRPFRDADDPIVEVGDRDALVLLFTSGTVTAPKAVICSHGRLVETGKNLGAHVYGLTPDDVGYLAMPLFHANSLMCGFLPALYYGAGLGMIRKFSKTRWLDDVRRYGVTFFNYTGKPLAYILSTPARADDADNPLRICFGNEGSHRVVSEFEARFGCKVIDVFGASEGGLGVTRQPGDPPNSIGFPAPGIIVADEHGNERPAARFAADGRLLNADECVGELVNTQGTAWFEGYYKNEEATADRTRRGWYWSGDLGYRDERGYLYFAGRDIEWLRVDGENFLGRPIEEILHRHADVVLAAVYGVPDPDGGDRVMAALILREGARFDPAAFAAFLDEQADLSPKWMPTYIRVSAQLPQTATAKVLKNELRRQKFRPDRCRDPVYRRERGEAAYRRFEAADYAALARRFEAGSKGALLDI
jgi:fatty-acyl-CoA synthase